ncbi:Helix-turn-helix domain-containing protein [Desulfotomaculum arcticum]|uniref:Helix-turn-helix domain-containing protein n=1 Tax=Desulfotruncus arcticus DSM 17038 TaxID=1121424 RepID=A0A1I2WG28_9FIRM|nr:Helix-turn-helix domain-containing protein [Desulfotomaculum arcticum] [Desulfotruncus arcticus DSM 17038]
MSPNNIFDGFISKQSLASFTYDRKLYMEFKPCRPLRKFIHCYWVLPVESGYIPTSVGSKEIVVPDGCMDIIFDIDNVTFEYSNIVVGIAEKPITVSSFKKGIQTYGVRFYPAGAYPLFRLPMYEFADSWTVLGEVLKRSERDLAEIFISSLDLNCKLKWLDSFFFRIYSNFEQNNVVMNTLDRIIASGSAISVKELARREIVSERHLARLFKQWVGQSPKTFARVVRFQIMLEMLRREKMMNTARLAAQCGYYDQSHFIGEFKTFSGKLPSDYMEIL